MSVASAPVALAPALSLASDPEPRTRLGRYLLRGRIGAGGMGVVYAAEEIETGRKVALKTLRERDPVALYHLKREFRALADVSHRNLVTLGELSTEGGRAFFTMELVDGVDFLSWVGAGPSPSDPAYYHRLRAGLRQIVSGMRALHGAGKVHCDLKPSNVLVARDGRVVILDFGLARDRPAAHHDSSAEVWGTALYMSPEQARSPRVGPPSDWYSVGIMLYRILTGRYPFRGTNVQILLDKQDREPPPPSTVVPGVPADLDELCVALLRCDPAARAGSAEILEILGGASDEERAAMSPDTSRVALDTVFVGRRAELSTLQRCLVRSRREHVAVLLRGPSGVGKTSLIREFLALTRARERDVVLLTGRCYERESVPYRALDGVIDSLSDRLRRLDQVKVARLLPDDAALLGRVFPVLRRVPAIAQLETSPPDVQDRQQVRARVFTALRQLLSRLADRGPVIVFVDDLQWADADGLALLADVCHAPDAPRLLLLATVRTDSSSELPAPLREFADGLDRVVDLSLPPLPPRDAEELAELLLERLEPGMVANAASIAADAAGHPLFIDELVRFHVGFPSEASCGDTGLDDAIWHRIKCLDHAGQELIATLAIAEVPLRLHTVSLATGMPLEITERLARMLITEHLARAVPSADDALAIQVYHDRVREVLVGRLGERERARFHGRLADALYAVGAAARTPMVLARHLALAGEAKCAAELAVDAAHRASAALAFDTAAELYRMALEMGDYPAPVVCLLQRGLAEALVNAGRGPEAATVLEQIAASADDSATRVDCLRRAAEQLLLTGHIERGLEVLDSVASECGLRVPATTRKALVACGWRRLRLRVRGYHWRPRDPEEVSGRALLQHDVYRSVGTILSLVDPIRGQALLAQSSLLALRLGVPDGVLLTLSTEALLRASLGDRKRAAALVEAATELVEHNGEPSSRAWMVGMLGAIQFAYGRFAEAVPLVEEAIALQAALSPEQRARISTGGVYETAVLRYWRMLSLALLGRCNELRREFHECVRDARRRGDRFVEANAVRGLNIVWLFDDDPERARSALAADLWSPPGDTLHLQHWMVIRSAIQTHLYCGTGDRARAEIAADLARCRRFLGLKVHGLGAEHHWMLGRLALAEAEAAGSDASEVRRKHREVRAAAKRIERIDLPQAGVTAALLRGGVAAQRGDLHQALDQLLRAESLAAQAGLRLIGGAARRRRGELIGGSAGEQLIQTVDRWARSEGIRCPEKIVRMYAPGFDRRP